MTLDHGFSMNACAPLKILLLGGSSGLGIHLLKRAIDAGAIVGATSHKSGISLDDHPHLLRLQCDVRNPLDIKKAVNEFAKFASGIDIAVYMPGILQPSLLSKIQHDAILDQISVNLVGAISMSREVLPIMLRQERGRIVFVSSVSVAKPTTGTCVYAATKAGLENLSKGISHEYSNLNIDSIAFRLPPVATQMIERVGANGLLELSENGKPASVAEPLFVANRMWLSLTQPLRSIGEITIDLSDEDLYSRVVHHDMQANADKSACSLNPCKPNSFPTKNQTLQSILEEVRSVAARIVSIDDLESLTADSMLADDLGADSLDAIKIVVELQRRTGLTLSDEELMSMTSLGEIANALYRTQEQK